MSSSRFEIHLIQYDSNWKEETVVLPHKGSIKRQMLDLMRGLRDKQGDRAIVMYLYNTETGESSDEYRF